MNARTVATIRWVVMLPVAIIGAASMTLMNQLLYAFLPRTPVDFWNGWTTSAAFSWLAFHLAPAHKWKVGISLIVLSCLVVLLGVYAFCIGVLNAPLWKVVAHAVCCVIGSIVGCGLAYNEELKDKEEAAEFTRRVDAEKASIDQNYADAQFYLGVCYAEGRGVPKDEVEAVKWYRKAAEQNHAIAQNNLGACYANGEGVVEDEAEAVKWYHKAAEQNFAGAQSNLGFCYSKGQGVVLDYAEAAKWYHKAAEQNYAGAQHNLGCCYVNGQGVVPDYAEAYKWVNLAAVQGDENAKKLRDDLEKVMTPERIAEGQRLAREFKPKQ